VRASASSLVFTFIHMILRVRVHVCVCNIHTYTFYCEFLRAGKDFVIYIYISTTPHNHCCALGLKAGVSISGTFGNPQKRMANVHRVSRQRFPIPLTVHDTNIWNALCRADFHRNMLHLQAYIHMYIYI